MTTETLPALTGTEKQIPWATDIRNEMLALLDEKAAKWQREVDDYAANPPKDEEDAEYQERAIKERDRLDNLRSALLGQTSAHDWIEERDNLRTVIITPFDSRQRGARGVFMKACESW